MPGPKILIVDDNTELLALLAQMIEAAGFTPLAFSRGKPAIEAARIERPALAVLDILLPDIMGYEVAAVCRRDLQIPVIFLTGVFKGDRQSLDAKTQYDALGYFEKPFEAQALLQVITKAVPPHRRAARPVAPLEDEGIEIDLDIEEETEASREPMELTGRIALKEQGGFSATLHGQPLTAAPALPRSSGASLGNRPGVPPAPPRGVSEPLTGTLGDNLPALFTAFYQAQKTGELSLIRGKVKKVIYFEHGQPVFAISNVLADRFGQLLVRVGKITVIQLEEALARARATGRRTGDILLELGLLQETEKLYYVGQQVKAIMYSLFGWEDGGYQITFQEQATSRAIRLDLAPATLIYRGVKKLYRPDRVRRLVSKGDRWRPSPDPPYQMTEIALEAWEVQILAAVDGRRTTVDLIERLERPEAVVATSLAALLALNLIVKVS